MNKIETNMQKEKDATKQKKTHFYAKIKFEWCHRNTLLN